MSQADHDAVKRLGADASDAELLGLCRQWVELVAADRLREALDLLWVPPEYDEPRRWTPESLGRYIENYGSWQPLRDGTKWRVTSIEGARAPESRPAFEPQADVVRLDRDRRAGTIVMDIPLNGAWSDLSALFEFRPVAGGTAVALYDLHVL